MMALEFVLSLWRQSWEECIIGKGRRDLPGKGGL